MPPRIAASVVSSILLAATAAAAQQGEVTGNPPRAYTGQPIAAQSVAGWRADLDVLVQGLERIHPEPYWRTPEARFDTAVTALRDSIPRLAAHQIIVGFARVLAMVGDGHTSLPLYAAQGVDFHVLPFRAGVYEGGVYIEAADRAYAELVGGRLVALGGASATDALRRVAPLISRDNDNWIAAVAPNLLNRIEVLHAVGIAGDLEGVDVTVEQSGRTLTRRVTALADPPRVPFGLPFLPRYTADWVDLRDATTAPVPLYQRRYEEIYFWEYLPGDDLLYIKWDQVQNRARGPSALETFREAMAFAREHRPGKTVIDIRNNTGGEGGLLPLVIREIVGTREVDQPGKLFLVIGRRTFSAGQMMTGWLEMFSTAILVGEPSSALYNGYAGHDFVHLPHSGVGAMVSPDYYQMGRFPGDQRQQATPTLGAVPTFEDYRNNRDLALQVIREYEPDRLERAILAALAAADTAAAVRTVLAYDVEPVNRFRNATAALNALGYRLLREHRQGDALAVFELNVRVHPEYVNGWDSLGEAYVHAGRRDDAIAAFRQALALEPGFPPSARWLRRLGVEP